MSAYNIQAELDRLSKYLGADLGREDERQVCEELLTEEIRKEELAEKAYRKLMAEVDSVLAEARTALADDYDPATTEDADDIYLDDFPTKK